MKTSLRLAIALVLLAVGVLFVGPADAVTAPQVSPSAIIAVRAATGITAAVGTAVRLTGTFGATWIEVTNGSLDGRADGVVIEAALGSAVTGKMVQVSFGNAQLKAASTIAFGDIVRVADSQGRWEKGDGNGRNNYYVAMQGAAANALFWARPIVGEARPRRFVSGIVNGTGAAQNTAHGLGQVPSVVKCWLTSVGAGGGDIAPGAHTSTNIIATVTSGAKYQCVAEVLP